MSRDIQPHIVARWEELRDSILDVLSELVGGKTVLLFGSATGSQLVRQYFLDSGASQVIDLSPTTRMPEHSISTRFQMLDDELIRPGYNLRAEVLRIDPKCQAIVYAGSCVTSEALDGRRVMGRRLTGWREGEKKKYQSKLTSDQNNYNPHYFDFLLGLKADDLLQYCMVHLPCVVSGDPKDCIAMGADYVYVLQEDTPFSKLADITRLLYDQCEGVRVAPLCHGIPATYYGIVSADRNVLYGPVEALVGFQPIQCKVIAPGILIPLSIPDRTRQHGSAHVARLVSTLVATTGYRGAYGIDGSFTDDGLIIHEINTRLCAGFSLLSRLCGNRIPFGIVDLIVREVNPDRCNRVLTLLGESTDMLRSTPDVKLWEDTTLENLLRQSIPSNGRAAELEEWKMLVRRSVFVELIPFYKGI